MMKVRRGNVGVSEQLLMESGIRLLPLGTEIVAMRYNREQGIAIITVDHESLPEIEEGDPIPDIACEITQISRYVVLDS